MGWLDKDKIISEIYKLRINSNRLEEEVKKQKPGE